MFSVVTDSQFELPQIFISQIGEALLFSEMGVSKNAGSGSGPLPGSGSIFFLKDAVLGLRLVSSLTLTLTLKQHSLKKKR